MIKSSWRVSRFSSLNRIHHFSCRICPSATLTVRTYVQTGQQRFTNREESHEDHTLRQIFDSQAFWNNFSQNSIPIAAKNHGGLFQNHFLIEPNGFLRYAHITQRKCQKIVDDVLSAASTEEYVSIPRRLDRLSDSLCRVLDVADFVRVTHPDPAFQKAATQAYVYLFDYMNVLNTTPGLNAQLQKAISTPEVTKAWTGEESTVARILLKDFSQSAIDLPQEERQKFVALSNQIKRLGGDFIENMTPKEPRLSFRTSQLKGMDPLLFDTYKERHGKISLPTTGEGSYAALGSIRDESSRREMYITGRQCSESTIETLESFVQTRAELASLSGYQSYAHMILSDKLAKSPEAVNSFLTALSTDNSEYALQEIAQMEKMKVYDGGQSEIRPWDVLYYTNRLNAVARTASRKSDFIAAYFSLGTVIQGLSRLFSRLYGIRFIAKETTVGETWNSDVRRLDVVHDTEGHVAVLYCDLFARSGKTPNPTHFTLRCSRLITSSELAEGGHTPQEANDGMAVSCPDSKDQCFQLPIIALVCDFSQSPHQHSPSLLAFQDVKTLFHEMGHAVHSILGRTSLQVVSGTRCPTDFAELPSVLMEYFASDAMVLSLFARHWETDAPLPYQMVQDAMLASKRGQGLQIETQLLFSLLDQAYHSSLPLITGSKFDSTKVLFDVYDKYASLHEPRETNAQGLFGHLVEYGGTYYSYLFDRAIAGEVWKQVFRSGRDGGGVDREAGERYKEEVLKWGGARSGWACISGLLGDERLREGGEKAMEQVGRWGVHD